MRRFVQVGIAIMGGFLGAAGIATAAAAQGNAEPDPLAAVGVEDLAAARERPLFAPSRRRPPPEPEAVAQTDDPVRETVPNLQLIGVVEISGRAFAIVSDLGTGATSSLEAGDTVGPWQVTAIEPARLSMSIGLRTTTFALFQPDRDRPRAAEPQDIPERSRVSLSHASSDTLLRIMRGEITITDKGQ